MPMRFFALLMVAPSCRFQIEVAQGDVKMVHHFFVRPPLVSFNGKDVVGIGVDDLLGDRDLGSHGIDGHGVAFEIELGEDLR